MFCYTLHMIEPQGVYTPKEASEHLKISQSTFKRMIKGGLIRANKVGGQYRILGHEILRVLSPQIDQKATTLYQKIKNKAHKLLDE